MAVHDFIHSLELGRGRRLILLFSIIAISAFVGVLYIFLEFSGFHRISSMDNAQLARSLAEGRGFTTNYIRPNNLAQLRAYYETKLGRPAAEVAVERFPEINRAPLYPVLLSIIYRTPAVNFEQDPREILDQGYRPEIAAIVFNQLVFTASAFVLLVLAVRMFDWRVGWLTMTVYLTCNAMWLFTLSAMPTNLVILFIASMTLCLHEAIWADESDNTWPVWILLPMSAVFFGLTVYTQYIFVWLLIPYILFVLVAFRFRLLPALVTVGLVVALMAPMYLYLYQKSGNPLGGNLQLLIASEAELGATEVEKNYIEASGGRIKSILRKTIEGFSNAFEHFFSLSGSSLAVVLFLVSFLHPFKRRRVLLLRLFVAGMLFFSILGTSLIFPSPETLSELNPIIPFWPLMAAYGVAMFFILLDRTGINLALLRGVIIAIFLLLCATPMILQLLPPGSPRVMYPPYHPPMLRFMTKGVNPGEMMMSDMAWATAWYTNRTSLLMPKNLEQFYAIHGDHHPVKALLLTPITWEESLIDIDKGKLENWAVLIKREGIPEGFPLTFPTALPPNDDEYLFFSDERRWESQ